MLLAAELAADGTALKTRLQNLSTPQRHIKSDTPRMPMYFDVEVSMVLPRRIWRRLLLSKHSTFFDLHLAIQDAFGWTNSHLFEFRSPGNRLNTLAGIRDNDLRQLVPDARRVRMKEVYWNSIYYCPGWCEYEYDFGDSWIHEVKVRGEVQLAETFHRRLLDGERAAPPEDSGGEPGYQRYVSIVERGIDPFGQPIEESLQWLAGWNPDYFDVDAVRATFDLVKRATRKAVKTVPLHTVEPPVRLPENVIAFPSGGCRNPRRR